MKKRQEYLFIYFMTMLMMMTLTEAKIATLKKHTKSGNLRVLHVDVSVMHIK